MDTAAGQGPGCLDHSRPKKGPAFEPEWATVAKKGERGGVGKNQKPIRPARRDTCNTVRQAAVDRAPPTKRTGQGGSGANTRTPRSSTHPPRPGNPPGAERPRPQRSGPGTIGHQQTTSSRR